MAERIFTNKEIIKLFSLLENGAPVLATLKLKEIPRHTYYKWQKIFIGMSINEIEEFLNEKEKKLEEKEKEKLREKEKVKLKKSTKFLPFTEARKFIHNLNLTSSSEWQKYCAGKIEGFEKPTNIPRSPEQIYRRSGWKSWNDWLNLNKYRDFDKAKEFVKTLNFTHKDEWDNYCNGNMSNLPVKPNDIPRNPNERYRKNWISWNDWLNSNEMMEFGQWRDFKEARDFVRNLHLSGTIEWKEYCNGELQGFEPKPKDIPATPNVVYKERGWIDYGDWLGTGRKRRANKNNDDETWLSYVEAKEFVKQLNLTNGKEWEEYIKGNLANLPKKPIDIPNSPQYVYKDDGWIDWYDWIGNENMSPKKVKNALPFEEARSFVRKLNLKNSIEWRNYKSGKMTHLETLPTNIPRIPSKYYKNDGWIGMLDWLGVE